MKTTATIAMLAIAAGAASAQELTTNGDFETGDTTGWDTSFLTGSQTFNITSDSNSGAWAAELFNNDAPSGAVVKQANIGIGQVNPGDEITVKFSAKGSFAAGGVLFAEFFSELDGGGTSSSEILSGGPIFVSDQQDYMDFEFTVTAGPDVSGGVTLQFVAATGGAPGSTAVAFIDDVSVFRVPSPSTAALLGLGGIAAIRRRR